jgi:zinc/manganese transport system ATP-binding protein
VPEEPVLRLADAALAFGDHQLWSGLDLDVMPGEFITILGANGSGKSSLLKAILGLQPLTAGKITMAGRRVARGDRRIGYVPQQRLFPPGTPMRGRDVVGFGIDGHRPGVRLVGRGAIRQRVDAAIGAVHAGDFADRPIGQLSGGEQQRLRIAQAMVSEPSILLCDEPLISLDLNHQGEVSRLIDQRRRSDASAVLFVTHDINPVLAFTDRVLYLAAGSYCVGTPEQVLRSTVLSRLYETKVEVTRVGGRIVVLGAPDHHEPHHAEVLA